MDSLKQHVVFLDPPWGGPDYRKHARLMLYLDDVPLHKIVNRLIDSAKLIVLKVPFNFDFPTFLPQINLIKCTIRRFPKYFVLFLSTRWKVGSMQIKERDKSPK